MITCFNDAKRVTLSAWSWPSRQIAHEMASSFAVSGDWTLNQSMEFDFQYLTPHNHAQLIDAIVESDLENVKSSLRQSLAVSLRLDGSVDRSGLHNIYVMAHILKRDLTTKTLFMGFGVPDTNRVNRYLQCLKTVVQDIIPWDEFFSFVTSVVTDGEPLNMGRLNGLCAQLKRERSLTANPKLPLYTIWCVAHRLNLSWKSTSRNNHIRQTIKHCRKLASFFRKSGVRTKDLKTAAQSNVLRYPRFFKIRWTEYVFNLLNVILRNYRASIKYFESKSLKSFLKIWLSHDRIYFIAFLADILSLLKKFQKNLQSDNINICDVLPLRNDFIASLRSCKTDSLTGGWEQLFLSSIVINGSNTMFHGIKLLRSGSERSFRFTTRQRHNNNSFSRASCQYANRSRQTYVQFNTSID